MKITKVEVNLFEKGDKVITADGEGVVQRDEVFSESYYERYVLVKYTESNHRIEKL